MKTLILIITLLCSIEAIGQSRPSNKPTAKQSELASFKGKKYNRLKWLKQYIHHTRKRRFNKHYIN